MPKKRDRCRVPNLQRAAKFQGCSLRSRRFRVQETMSTRKLGGGRVLGGRRSLSANVATLTQRNTSFLSPTGSSVSVNSSRSTSQQSLDPQDLSSRVSLEQSDDNNAAAVAAATSLVCPICNEETVSSV